MASPKFGRFFILITRIKGGLVNAHARQQITDNGVNNYHNFNGNVLEVVFKVFGLDTRRLSSERRPSQYIGIYVHARNVLKTLYAASYCLV